MATRNTSIEYCQEVEGGVSRSASASNSPSAPYSAASAAANTNYDQIPINFADEFPNLYFRSILPVDRRQIQVLHEQWFPVTYHDEFFDTLVHGHLPPQEKKEQRARCRRRDDEDLAIITHCNDDDDDEDDDEEDEPFETGRRNCDEIRPLFTYVALEQPQTPQDYMARFEARPDQQINTSSSSTSTSTHSTDSLLSMEEARDPQPEPVFWPVHARPETANETAQSTSNIDRQQVQAGDRIVACIVGAFIEADYLSVELQNLLVPRPDLHSKLFYIMTLGIADHYRKHGLASHLIEECIAQQILPDPTCGALYLHVLDSNVPAIRFYEKLGFSRVKLIPNYYTINGRLRHCYLYAKYFHGNRGHFTIFTLLKQGLQTLWKSLSAPLSLFIEVSRPLPFSSTHERTPSSPP